MNNTSLYSQAILLQFENINFELRKTFFLSNYFCEQNNVHFQLLVSQLKSGNVQLLACGECSSCCQLKNNNHPDLKVFGKNQDLSKKVGVEDIKPLIKETQKSPVALDQKFFFIENAELLSLQAQNSILKSIEEPNIPAVFFLNTHKSALLLPTIKSRCLSFNIEEKQFLPFKEQLFALNKNIEWGVRNEEEKKHTVFQKIHLDWLTNPQTNDSDKIAEIFKISEEFGSSLEEFNIFKKNLLMGLKEQFLNHIDNPQLTKVFKALGEVEELSVFRPQPKESIQYILLQGIS